MRRTKIVATLGPATDDPEVLDALLAAGVDVVRLNAAHADTDQLNSRLRAVRWASAKACRHVGVLVDLPGPKIRVGEVAPGTVLAFGARFTLSAEECIGDANHACVTYPGMADDLSAGDHIMLDDGRVELEVERVEGAAILTRVVVGGPLLSHKGVNVPGVTLGVDAITDVDRRAVEWACDADVDFLGQSFVRSAADVANLRALLTRDIAIVAKIEKHEAVSALAEIIDAVDAVMVARGDLGVETSPEEVPVIQRRIIAAARAAGKPVVIATQMLESMTHAPRPTRAEASDVANAIFGRADAVMLSGETAVGEYPIVVVETMARIASTAEKEVSGRGRDGHGATSDVQEAVSAAVCDLATDLGLAAIVPVTQSGATAFAVAKHRPDTHIVAVTPSSRVARHLALLWGTQAIVAEFADDTDQLLHDVCANVRDAGLAKPGERVAITAGRASRTRGGTDFILVREL
jgi:pyruvate kinase